MALVERVHHCEAVERVILKIELFIGFTGHYEVKGEFPVLLHVEVFISSLFLEQRYNYTLIPNFICDTEQIGS